MKRLWPCLACLCASCAGPTTPFGALRTLWPEAAQVTRNWALNVGLPDPGLAGPQIRFSPARQVLHERSRWTVIIDDPDGVPRGYSLQLIYNGQDVTKSFLSGSRRRLLHNGTRLEISMRSLRLPADQEHQVDFRYKRNPKSRVVTQAAFESPVCHPFRDMPVVTTGRFRPPMGWMKSIESSAREEGINPNLLTALIAQESGFNPRAVSWARALGLTQVTPLADSDLAKIHTDWPRYEKIDEMSAPHLKMLIALGDLTADDDWRLDPQLSIQGGLTYLRLLQKYWTQSGNTTRVKSSFHDSESGLLKLVLASYNSGPSRVSKAFQERGADFLRASDLNEARRYVGRITSYCDQFSSEVSSDENPS